jgi:hypothetical protein
VDQEWFFSNPDPYPDPTFKLVSDPYPDPVKDHAWIFSNILNINFTSVFPSCKSVTLYIMTRYWLFRAIFFIKRNYLFQIHFRSGSARNRSDFFRIRIRIRIMLKVSDPIGSWSVSGSTTLSK